MRSNPPGRLFFLFRQNNALSRRQRRAVWPLTFPADTFFCVLRSTRLRGCLAALWSAAQSRFMGLPFLPQPIPQRAYIFYPNDYP